MQKKQAKKATSLDEDDFQLFRDAVQDIIPLEHDKTHHQTKKPINQARQADNQTEAFIADFLSDEVEAENINSLDFQLFRDAVQNTTPLEHDKIHHQTKKPLNPSRQVDNQTEASIVDFLSDEAEVESINPLDSLSYCINGIQKRVFKKLRRGQYIIIDELDLHGLNSKQAKKLLLNFLESALQVEGSCICIIHGKGHRSGDKEPVIKRQTNHWLKQHPRVLAFHSAQPKDGGTGAVYVLLRRTQLSAS